MKKKLTTMDKIKRFLIGCAVIFILSIIACSTGGMVDEEKNVDSVPMNSDQKEVKKEEKKIEYIKVTAKDLINNYEDNELKADSMYKDKHVEITGKVVSIDKVLGSISVTLGSGKDFEITKISCYFHDKYEKNVAELVKDSEIVITGVCEGKGWNVNIKDCEIK